MGKAIGTLAQREQVVRADLMVRNRMPRHAIEGAVATMREEHGMGPDYMGRNFEKHLGKTKPIDVWKEAVEDNFEQVWAEVTSKATDDEAHSDQEEEDATSFGTCSVTLRQIIRPDMESHLKTIPSIPSDRQAALTRCIDELSALTHKTNLAIASGEIYTESNEQLIPQTFDVAKLLPSDFKLRSDPETVLNVAPLQTQLMDRLDSIMDTPKKIIPHNGGRKGHPVVSQLEGRKKDNRKKGRRSPWLEMFLTSQMSKDDVKTKAKDAVAAVKDLEEEIKPLRKDATEKLRDKTAASDSVRKKEPGSYDVLYKAIRAWRASQTKLVPKPTELQDLRQISYQWNYILKAAESYSSQNSKKRKPGKQITPTAPTWSHWTVEDSVEHLDITQLKAPDNSRRLAFGGTDYGLHKEIETHLNRSQCLQDGIDGPEFSLQLDRKAIQNHAPTQQRDTHNQEWKAQGEKIKRRRTERR
ncbi:hypothetical protein B0O80DRAFT_427975 [Mortierella sp. GBAus27b]|nr:hypothetical protein B0O80DRAFT_427975 [Mortierella sp. GBAus27b]